MALLLNVTVIGPSIGLAIHSEPIQKMRVGTGPKKFKIGLDPGTFPPFTSGEFKGIDFEVLKAVCEANPRMRCELQLREFSECSIGDGVGSALEQGAVDGCINWVETAPRKVQGFEFSDPYHTSSPPQLICVADMVNSSTCAHALEITEAEPLLNLNNAIVGFVSGFFAAPSCLNDVYDMSSYTAFEENGENPILSDRDLIEELNNGSIHYGFWDTTTPVPDGMTLAGVGVPSCGSHNSLLLYPPSTRRPHKSDAVRRAWNCGLALVRNSPELLADLRQALEIELGRPPLDPQEFMQDGPLPTVQCLEEKGIFHSDGFLPQFLK